MVLPILVRKIFLQHDLMNNTQIADAMKLLKLDEDKRKRASTMVNETQEKPESTGDLLGDIRKAGGSAAKASSMVNRHSATSAPWVSPNS